MAWAHTGGQGREIRASVLPLVPFFVVGLLTACVSILGCGTAAGPAGGLRAAKVVDTVSAVSGRVAAGAWIEQDRTLLLLMRSPNQIIAIRPDGRSEVALVFPNQEYPDFTPYSELAPGPGGTYWVLGSRARILQLDHRLQAVDIVELSRLRDAGCPRLVGVYQPVFDGGDIIALLACRSRHGWDFFGYGRVNLGAEPFFNPHWPLDESMDAGGLAWFIPTLARAGDGVFALVFGDSPAILSLLPVPMMLQTFPDGFRDVPELGRDDPGTFRRFLQNLEEASAAVGLYGQGDYLYLLTRKPTARSTTTWQLHRINPATDRLEETRVLPTDAPHIRLIPGERYWAIVEQGEMAPDRSQPTRRILFLDRHDVLGAPTSR